MMTNPYIIFLNRLIVANESTCSTRIYGLMERVAFAWPFTRIIDFSMLNVDLLMRMIIQLYKQYCIPIINHICATLWVGPSVCILDSTHSQLCTMHPQVGMYRDQCAPTIGPEIAKMLGTLMCYNNTQHYSGGSLGLQLLWQQCMASVFGLGYLCQLVDIHTLTWLLTLLYISVVLKTFSQ